MASPTTAPQSNILLNSSEIDPLAVKILFVPDQATGSDEQIQQIYKSIDGVTFDTVVFVESRIMDITKKIPMPSVAEFDTGADSFIVNDALRNEFCDEDDDFFIDDSAHGKDMQIYRHLPLLKSAIGDFKVVSVPICDDDPAIVRELDYVLSEIMGGRNILLVVACSMPSNHANVQQLYDLVNSGDISNLMNRVNSGECDMSGSAAFMGGILIAKSWELSVKFLSANSDNDSAIAGCAVLEPKI